VIHLIWQTMHPKLAQIWTMLRNHMPFIEDMAAEVVSAIKQPR
jgi:hypothetical protein